MKDILIFSFASSGYPEETFPQHEVLLHRCRFPSIILEEPYGHVPTPEELAERMEREDEEDKKNVEHTEDGSSNDEDGATVMKNDDELSQALVCKKREETDYSEDDADEEEEVGEDQPCLAYYFTDEEKTSHSTGNQKKEETSRRRRHITFSNHRHVFHYPKGGALGCSYEDEEVEEDTPEDGNDYHDNAEVDKQDEDDDLQKTELEMEEDDPLMEAERLGFSTQFTCDPDEQEVDIIDFLLTYKPEDVINSEQSGTPSEVLRRRYKNHKRPN